MLDILCLTAVMAASCHKTDEKKEILNPPKTDVIITDADTHDVRFSQMPLGTVRAESWLYNQLRMQADNITGDFESLCPDVKSDGDDRSGWLGGSGESWERGPYYVKGLVSLAYTLQDEALIKKAQKWIDAAIESQTESGAFGPFAGTPNKIDWWALMPMVSAVEYYYDATCDINRDERVIPFLEKYFAFQSKRLSSMPLKDWAQARAGDNIDSVYWLYKKTGDSSLLDLCRKLYKYTNWADIYVKDKWSGSYHIVNTHQGFKLLPLMYEITGEKEYLDKYYEGLVWLDVESGRADGMSNGDEMTGTISATNGTETCAVAERMLSDEIALRITKDSDIADHLEFIGYNIWPSQLTEKITGQVYFTMQNQVTAVLGAHGFTSDGGDRQVYGTPGGYPCCSCNFHMGWPLFVNSMWMHTDDGGTAAGAYGPNSVSFNVQSSENQIPVKIIQNTDYPFRNSIKLTVKTERQCRFPIYLRVPSWCSEPQLYVNGERCALPVTDGYFRIEAAWDNNDQIKLIFPETIESYYAENNSVYIKRGALLYTLGIKENIEKIDYNPNAWNLTEKYKSVNMTPAEAWNYALYNFNIENAAEFFTVSEKTINSDMTFSRSNAPVILKGKAVLVNNWDLRSDQSAQRVPLSPVASGEFDSKTVEISLIPYGFARLRVTYLPWTGDNTVSFTPQKAESKKITFYRVTVPYAEKEGAIEKVKMMYPLKFSYKAEENITCGLYINGIFVETLTFDKGEGSCESQPVYVDSSKYNMVELRSENGGKIENLSNIKLSFGEAAFSGIICLEAEHAKLSGSAYSNGSYVAGIDDVGSSLHFSSFNVSEDGEYIVRVYHAAAIGKATHTLIIDGKEVGTLSYPGTSKWGVFSDNNYAECAVKLTQASHSMTIIKSQSDIGFAEVDRIEIIKKS